MIIESPQNPRVRQWKRLLTAKGRRDAGRFLAEGPHLVDEAFNSGLLIRELLVQEGHDPPLEAGSAAEEVITVSERVMRAVCDADSPQWLAGVVSFPPESEVPEPAGLVLLLDAVQDPGNVGALVRASDACGVSYVFAGQGSADPWSPRALRAAQGSTFHLPVLRGDVRRELERCRAAGLRAFATGPGRGADCFAVEPPAAAVLVLGNEGNGLSADLMEACDDLLTIPMRGRAESLGVALAGAVLLFHLARGAAAGPSS